MTAPGRGGDAGRPRIPRVTLRTGEPVLADTTAVAVVVLPRAEGESGDGAKTGRASRAAERVCAELGTDLPTLLAAQSFAGDAGALLTVPLARQSPPVRLHLLGVGAGAAADWRSAGATLARRASGDERLVLVTDDPGQGALAGLTEGLVLASYRPPRGADVTEQPAAAPVVLGSALAADVEAGGAEPTRTELAEAAAQAGPAAAGQTDDVVAAAGAPGDGAAPAGGDGGGRGIDEVVVVLGGLDEPGLAAATEAVRRANVTARAVLTARNLINTPSLVKSPEWLVERASDAARAAGLDVTVLGPRELAAGGFGGLLAVGRGSSRPPYLVQLGYRGPAGGADASGDPGHRVLVGKGITFDSGGLSLKPANSMVGMKTDMAGAAAVLATMLALPELGAPGRVTGLLCIAENMISASAMRPGDVITCWGGRTVEVLNTDAEGRLVLADGLAYAAATLAPDAIVDLATLTGAITVALGKRTAGLFASDDALAAALTTAAEAAGERVWRLPLVEDYRPALDSPVADLTNIGKAVDVSGGSITAALFLREFTAGLPWAHLDIAGTARSDSDDGELTRGATGWGVRTLLRWLTTEPTPAGAGALAGAGAGARS